MIATSQIVLVTAVAFCSAGFYYRRIVQADKTKFRKIQKCQKFHMDYVQQAQNLPLNMDILIFGPINSTDKQKIIMSSLRKITKDQDYWKQKLDKPFVFMTASNEQLQVSPSAGTVQMFNLPLSGRLHNGKLVQRAILDGSRVCVYGKVSKDEKQSRLRMIPQIIIGSKQQNLLEYLDKRIIKNNKKSMILTGLGTCFLLCHAIYYHSLRYQSDVYKQMQQFEKKSNV